MYQLPFYDLEEYDLIDFDHKNHLLHNINYQSIL
jgi:hypothetical protein